MTGSICARSRCKRLNHAVSASRCRLLPFGRDTHACHLGRPQPLPVLPRMMQAAVGGQFRGRPAKHLVPAREGVGQRLRVGDIAGILRVGDHKPVPIDRQAHLGAILGPFGPLAFADGHDVGFVQTQDLGRDMAPLEPLGILVDDAADQAGGLLQLRPAAAPWPPLPGRGPWRRSAPSLPLTWATTRGTRCRTC